MASQRSDTTIACSDTTIAPSDTTMAASDTIKDPAQSTRSISAEIYPEW